MSNKKRPTVEDVTKARERLARIPDPTRALVLTFEDALAIEVLLAATEPPTDEEIASASDAFHETRFGVKMPRDGIVHAHAEAVVRHFFGPVKP